MTSASKVRNRLVDFVRGDLIGPAHGEDEVLEDPPRIRYCAGVLFPRESMFNESAAVSGIEGEDESHDHGSDDSSTEEISSEDSPETELRTESVSSSSPETDYDDSTILTNAYKPSAMGLSFLVDDAENALAVEINAAVYNSASTVIPESQYKKTLWKRVPLDLAMVLVPLNRGEGIYSEEHDVIEGLRLKYIVRPRSEGRKLVTVTLYNTTLEHSKSSRTFFQVGFVVRGATGLSPFVDYRQLVEENSTSWVGKIDEEEQGLSLLYRERSVFAIGHGCSADWKIENRTRSSEVSTTVMPSVVVPPIVPFSENVDYLNMEFLMGKCSEPSREIPSSLRNFCEDYDRWIDSLDVGTDELAPHLRPAASRNIALCRVASHRMKKGVDLLEENAHVLDTFMNVNRVMLMQQDHSRRRRSLGEEWIPLPASDGYSSDWEMKKGYWRTFQIAFVLMTLPSLAADEDEIEIGEKTVSTRDIVDLIWFPTGGGKTEAYLALTAFVIFWSRLKNPEDSGCRVLMRYTLRLLTSQQFQRAASLICACELLRRENPERYGASPITIGLWVGESLTPNREKDAIKQLNLLSKKSRDAKNPFQLLSCPWCGTELNNRERLGYDEVQGRMIFKCPSVPRDGGEGCPFSSRHSCLPVSVVDESIYRNPSTLIIGTVDKFAMLAWRDEAGKIFETGSGPHMIIQDELHLISGPLGSMVGLYEGIIDYMSSRSGARPKIIASTATIRRAREQCLALYDREMFQFPPPGISASDSYFARESRDDPGREYIGFLPTASSSPLTAQIRSVVALQQGAVLSCDEKVDEALDPYWTLVQYFGSLKELGRAATFTTADIPEFLPTMHRRYDLVGDPRRRWLQSHEELTSRVNEDEIPKILKKLEVGYSPEADRGEQALDTVLATNMISVGVDVDRLGLMMVVTQPKGTSEYIQASSRVGRSSKRPGLVFTLYNASRPRDRSHYEQFRGYHEAFYRFVEPTSVTPFSPPAMERALHAVLVIAARHVAHWTEPSEFTRTDPTFEDFIEYLRDRVCRIDFDHHRDFEMMLDQRLQEWEHRVPERWGSFGTRDFDSDLMKPAGSLVNTLDDRIWDTPTSMRNVDVECSGMVIPKYSLSREAD